MWSSRGPSAPDLRTLVVAGLVVVALVVVAVVVTGLAVGRWGDDSADNAAHPARPIGPVKPESPVPLWPIESGVPHGTKLRPSGPLTISKPHTVIHRRDVSGEVRVSADHVTIRQSRVTARSWVVISIDPGVRDTRIIDVEVDGKGRQGEPGSVGIQGPATIVRTEVHSVENGIIPATGSEIRDSWIHTLEAPGPEPHYDGFQLDGGQHDVLIEHNVVNLTDHDRTSAVMIDNDFGPVDDVTVRGNRLLGGSFTVYADGKFSDHPISGVSYVGNRMGRGDYGYGLIRHSSVTWAGNIDDETERPVHVS